MAMTESVAVLSTDALLPKKLVTWVRVPFEVDVTHRGVAPTAGVAVTVLVVASMTDKLSLPAFTT